MYVLRKRMAQGDAEALHSKPYKFPVKVFESSTLSTIGEKEVKIIDKNLNVTVTEADDIVTCYTKSNSSLTDVFEKVNASGIPVITVGDAKSHRNLHAAVKEGAMFSVTLDPDYCVTNPNGALLDELPIDVKKQLGF